MCKNHGKEYKPHKHAAVIKAWADGAEIQFKKPDRTTWLCLEYPSWNNEYEYRVKPKTRAVEYRLYAYKSYLSHTDSSKIGVAMLCNVAHIEKQSYFIKWLGDWQTVEIEE